MATGKIRNRTYYGIFVLNAGKWHTHHVTEEHKVHSRTRERCDHLGQTTEIKTTRAPNTGAARANFQKLVDEKNAKIQNSKNVAPEGSSKDVSPQGSKDATPQGRVAAGTSVR